jgi:hypothetical protein
MSCITKKLMATQSQSLTKRWAYYIQKAADALRILDLTDATSISSDQAAQAPGDSVIAPQDGQFVVAWQYNVLVAKISNTVLRLYTLDNATGKASYAAELDVATITGETSSSEIIKIHYANPNTFITVFTREDSVITLDISTEDFSLLDRYALTGGQTWDNDFDVIEKCVDPYYLSQSLYSQVYNTDYIFVHGNNAGSRVVWWFDVSDPDAITLVEYADVSTSGIGTELINADNGLAYYNSNTDSGKVILFRNGDDPDFNSFNFSDSAGSLSADTGSTTTTGVFGDSNSNTLNSEASLLYGTTIVSLFHNENVTKSSSSTFTQTSVTVHTGEIGNIFGSDIVHRQGYLYAFIRDDGVETDVLHRLAIWDISGANTTAPVLVNTKNMGINEIADDAHIQVDPRLINTS